jgi:hypothetical protein
MKRRGMAIAAGALALGAVSALGLAMSGSATARGSDCPDGKLCLWQHNEGGGEQVNIRDKRGVSNKLANKMNNEASSLINRTEHRVFVYDKRDGKGDLRCFEPGDEIPDLGALGFNDLASSTRVTKQDFCPVDDPPKARGGGCPEGKLCLWADNEGGGQQVNVRGRGVSNKLANKMNNEASSLVNETEHRVYVYDKRDAKGDRRCFEPEAEIADLGADAGFNDIASSTRIATGETCPGGGPPKARGDTCPDEKLCLWAGQKGSGQRVAVGGKGVSNKLANQMNNKATSLINNTGRRVLIHDKRDAKGELRCYDNMDDSEANFDSVGFDNVASSTRITKGDTCPVDDPPRARRGPPCPNKALCVFEHNDFGGERIVITRVGVSNKLFKRFDDTASSAVNNRGKASYLYSEKNAEGDRFCIERHSSVGDLMSFNDAASSSRNASARNCLR